MKKYLIYGLLGSVVIVGGFFAVKNKPKPNLSTLPQGNENSSQVTPPQERNAEELINSKAVSFIEGKLYNLCQVFPKEKIEEFSGKRVITAKPDSHKELDFTQYSCSYYQEEAKYGEVSKVNIAKKIAIVAVKGNTKRIKEGYKFLNLTLEKDKDILFNHWLAYNQEGKFQFLDLPLADDLNLRVETWWSLLSQDEALQFVKKFALYFSDLTQSVSSSSSEQNLSPTDKNVSSNQTVPLPADEDIIRNFVSLIEEGRADKAAQMIRTNSESEKQAWGVQFAAISSFKLLRMEKANEEDWTDKKHIYKVLLEVSMDPKSATAPIPYYGWENGQNTRWITLEKVGDVWKIVEIATGS